MKRIFFGLFLLLGFLGAAQEILPPRPVGQSDGTLRTRLSLQNPAGNALTIPNPYFRPDMEEIVPEEGQWEFWEYGFFGQMLPEDYEAFYPDLLEYTQLESYLEMDPQRAFMAVVFQLTPEDLQGEYENWDRWGKESFRFVPGETMTTYVVDHAFLKTVPMWALSQALDSLGAADPLAVHPRRLFEALEPIMDYFNRQGPYFEWVKQFVIPPPEDYQPQADGSFDVESYLNYHFDWDETGIFKDQYRGRLYNTPDWVWEWILPEAIEWDPMSLVEIIDNIIEDPNYWLERDLYSYENVSQVARRGEPGLPGTVVLNKVMEFMDSGREIIGSCYDYIYTTFQEAGYIGPTLENIFVGKEGEGPYVNPAIIRPGDWIMYDNQYYFGIGHSGIFVQWMDFERQSAMVISYPGGDSREPGRFKEYDISRTWFVLRGRN